MPITVERDNDKIVITLPDSIDPIDLRNGISYFKLMDIIGRSQATQDDIEELSNSVNSSMSKPIIAQLRDLEEFKEL